VRLATPISQSELAQVIRILAEILSRLLAELERDRLIDRRNSRIVILSREFLTQNDAVAPART